MTPGRCIVLCATLALFAFATEALANEPLSADNANCLGCHGDETPGVLNQWKRSRHAQVGVGCLDCHSAKPTDIDAYEHHEATIATLVTPNDCGECHEHSTEQFQHSPHAAAGQLIDSPDAFLANLAGGHSASIMGCESCHGARVEIDPDSPNKLSARSWPNSGIGRINPDGSLGACSACHTRHYFNNENARRPEACGKCHLGPDHPQKEAYESSKHGIAYATNIERMNLDAKDWVVGLDYSAAPTCATCHMSATRTQSVTHDVSSRISWNLRTPVSERQEDWERKRRNMKDTCAACHGETFTNNYYAQFDAVVRLYDEKFAIPAREIMALVNEAKLLERSAAFGNELEWIYWELWHREGRAARHGASKMSPEYTWWHGMYEVIQTFYFEFIPAARALGNADVDKKIDEVLADPKHQWFTQNAGKLKKELAAGAAERLYEGLFEEVPRSAAPK